jgi:hypothetical protein
MAETAQRCNDNVLLYLAKGWALAPVQAGEKRCLLKGWPDRKFDIADFGPDDNVALKTGSRSGHIADVDLDCPEAIELADLYLPETGAIFGRPSNPRSHWLYEAAGATYENFADPVSGEVLLELRADGAMGGVHLTILPPSVADGECREWDGGTIEPASVDCRILRRRCAWLAVGCLTMRYVGETPARIPWGPDWELPRLLWECDHQLGRPAYRWLRVSAPDQPVRHPRQRFERSPIEVELDTLAAAIPNHCDWHDWNRIGMAFFAASDGSEEGFIAFDDFSAKSARYDPRETRARWQNYGRSPPSQISKGTLIHLARQAGWRPGDRRYG